ncbi:hypothetical protein KFK09_014854 [Dendrobium nobile]|uniref:Uncharacterized protein n=1 Tax=Dendrobium nobile TaxID=94219 RepID=A0A8T3B498_DENNO|nr:hypothetical protein KFK09_014854 [Dendrobium nobile]
MIESIPEIFFYNIPICLDERISNVVLARRDVASQLFQHSLHFINSKICFQIPSICIIQACSNSRPPMKLTALSFPLLFKNLKNVSSIRFCSSTISPNSFLTFIILFEFLLALA